MSKLELQNVKNKYVKTSVCCYNLACRPAYYIDPARQLISCRVEEPHKILNIF